MGKGSGRRPCCTSREEQDLREEYARSKGKMSIEEFDRRLEELKKQGKYFRNLR